MDIETLKLLLSTQDQAYRGAMELMLTQVHEEISSLKSTVGELRRSLEFTQAEIDDLRGEVKQLEKEKAADKSTIQELMKQCRDTGENCEILEDRCDYFEDYSRRNNIHITGMEEIPGGESWEQTAEQVQKLLADKMQLPDLTLERAHRVGQRTAQRPRPVVARFLRYGDRELVMRNARKLKGTNIYVNDDLCPASQEKRRQQLPHLKQARSEGKIAYFRHTKLIIREREPVLDAHQRSSPEEPDSNPPAAAAAAADANTVGSTDAAGTSGRGSGMTRESSRRNLRSKK